MNVVVATSTVADGNMLISTDQSNVEVIANRTAWLARCGTLISDTTRVRVVYEGNSYLRYHVTSLAEKSHGMLNERVITADGLATKDANHTLFLPIADCIGAVLHDPTKHILMLSHLGRHSLEQNGGQESVQFMIDTFGCSPADILVQLTPAAGRDKYPMFAFDNRSLKNVALTQLAAAGILPGNIKNDSTETTTDVKYYSHSDFLLGNRDSDGRHAVIAYMTD